MTEHVGEDASLDPAVAAIMAKMPSRLGKQEEPKDTRDNREDRDATEMDDYHALEDLEALERQNQGHPEEGKEPSKTKGDEEGEAGEEVQAEDDAFIELPAAEEGKEPERVPLKEAIEAVQKVRQMNGEIAQAVIKAEDEAFQKHDVLTQQLADTFKKVESEGRIAMEMMRAYAPKEPNPHDYASSEDFFQAKLDYDAYVKHYQKVAAWVKASEQGSGVIGTQQVSEFVRRETERAARFIPEFKDDTTRAAKMKDYLDVLGPRFGLSQSDLDEIADHRAWRIIDFVAKTVKSERAAPVVRKHVQEKAAKLVNGRLPDRDKGSGRFISDARKELKDSGSEDSFARLLLRSGALKNL